MMRIVFSFLLLATQALAIELDVNDVATTSRSGSLDDVETFIQQEAQVLNTLIELDNQLNNLLDQVSSASGSTELDVVVGQPDTAKRGSDRWIHDEIVVVVPPGAHLSDEQKETIKQEIEAEVADTLDAMIVVGPPEEEVMHEGSQVLDRVTRLFEEEAQAEKDLEQMKGELRAALDNLSASGDTEIDVVTTESDGGKDIVTDEVVVVIPGSGPRLTEQEKEKLEEEIVEETADALGAAIMDEFLDDVEDVPSDSETVTRLQDDPRLEESSPRENTFSSPEKAVQVVGAESEPKPAFRSAVAAAIAQPGFEHPIFVPHHWQMPPDEQLWTMKLSMLTSISCMTLLLIVGVWTGVRRSRRHTVMDDSHFRWAEAVEYMDAFPYDP
uniref:RxLR effector protein n=1 Tax=Phytophthora ramorum TaxID=164328 RepID=H3H1X1_PHYRM